MDIEQKKIEVKEDIADGPSNVIFARIGICNEMQLADLMKVQFTSYFRGAANTSHSNSDTLPDVCHKLAQQRALLHGASVSGIMKFNIAPGTAYTSTGSLTFPQFVKRAMFCISSLGTCILYTNFYCVTRYKQCWRTSNSFSSLKCKYLHRRQ